HWYKDGLQGTEISNNKFVVVSLEFANKVVSEQSPNEISKAISKKCKFGELWGLERKIIVNTIENNNDDIYNELSVFFYHPKKSDSKRIKSVIENFNTKTQYKCKVCKQKGHNSKTCKEKKPLDIDKSDETE
ncbi:9168_t:CDS:2, partial [Scutellospora calospora]